MNFNLKKYNTAYKNVRKVGLLKSIVAIVASLFITYFGLAIITKLIFQTPQEALIISLLLNTFVWPCLCIWIFVSSSAKVLFLRVFIPSFIITVILIFFTF